MLVIQDVHFSYGNGLVLQGMELSIRPGERVGLLGPNGSGKTTLIRLAGGALAPSRGQIQVDGREVHRYPRRQLARKLAVVPQELHVPFAFTVLDMVLLGRTPFLPAFAAETEVDRAMARRCMELTETLDLANRPFNELSGGERQRVVLAMALAQEPKLLLLDEPTVHLDISHQVQMLELVQRLNREEGITVLATMHDLNLAALYFPRLVLMHRGRVVADGAPSEVLQPRHLEAVFGGHVQVQKHPTRDVPHVVVVPNGSILASPDPQDEQHQGREGQGEP